MIKLQIHFKLVAQKSPTHHLLASEAFKEENLNSSCGFWNALWSPPPLMLACTCSPVRSGPNWQRGFLRLQSQTLRFVWWKGISRRTTVKQTSCRKLALEVNTTERLDAEIESCIITGESRPGPSNRVAPPPCSVWVSQAGRSACRLTRISQETPC